MTTVKQGYLQKYSSGLFKGWKQKYFVLYGDGHLVIHDTRGGAKAGSFLLHRDCRDIQVGAGIQAKIPQLPISHSIDLVFLLIMREKRFLLIADNIMEFDSWMQVLNNARSSNNGYTTGPPHQYPTPSTSYRQPLNQQQLPYQPQPTAPPPTSHYQPPNTHPSAPPSYAPSTNGPPLRPAGPALGFESLSLNPPAHQPGTSGYNAYPPPVPSNQQQGPYPPQHSNYPPQPLYNQQQPPYNQQQTPYNQQQPSYNQHQPSYNQQQPPYNQQQPPYNQQQLPYNQHQPPYNNQQGYQQPYYPQQSQGYAGGSAYSQQQGYHNNKPHKSSGLGSLGGLGGMLGSAGSVLGGGGKKSKRNKALLGGGAAALVGGYALSKVGRRGSWGSFGSFGSFGSCGS